MRCALADHRLGDNQVGPAFAGNAARVGDGAVDRSNIVAVDRADHIPAVGTEARRGVIAKPVFDFTIDRDAVVVVDRKQLAELPHAGERRRFVRYAFHQAAVTDKDIGLMVDDRDPGPIEFNGEQFFRERHADSVGKALPQRSGGGLNAWREPMLRMTRRLAVQLPEVGEFRHRQVVAREVQQRVLQHRAVPVGQHEPIAIGPARIGRVVAQVPLPEGERNLGHSHRHAGVTRVGLLHRIHGQGADGVAQIAIRYGGSRGVIHEGGLWL